MSTTFTMRIDEGQKKLISEFAASQGKSMAEFMLEASLDIIEDAIDLRDWNDAMKEYEVRDHTTYSHDEVMREFGMR